MKKKTMIVVGIAVGILALVILWFVTSYNGLVNAQVTVDEKSATIDTMLTRRADLIPNLVNTVKGYAAHEQEVYTALAEARAKLNGSNNTEDRLEANNQLDAALSRLLVIVERYPELKADRQFVTLMDQLEGAENRISTARVDYNTAVKQYNARIRRFPSNVLASLFNFEARGMYEAPADDKETPEVSFD